MVKVTHMECWDITEICIATRELFNPIEKSPYVAIWLAYTSGFRAWRKERKLCNTVHVEIVLWYPIRKKISTPASAVDAHPLWVSGDLSTSVMDLKVTTQSFI